MVLYCYNTKNKLNIKQPEHINQLIHYLIHKYNTIQYNNNIIEMSHLLQTQDVIQSKCILSIPCKQIITPKYRHLLKQSLQYDRVKKKECEKQQIIMKHLYQKYAQKQLQKMEQQNQQNLKKQFVKIKQRLKKQALRKNSDSQVCKFFQHHQQTKSLSSILKARSQNVEIGVKYQSKIMNRLFSIKQTQSINKDKQSYRNWLNSCNNSPLKSVNYTKMNYVLQKVNKNNKNNMLNIFNNQIKNVAGLCCQKNTFRVNRKMRSTQNLCININNPYNLKGEYSPKSRHYVYKQKSQ